MNINSDGNLKPAVYVGTYHKYNSGSLGGEWIDLDLLDREGYYEKIRALHADESDPEYMIQDHEDLPDAFCSEAGLDDRVWEWLELDPEDRLAVGVYVDGLDSKASITGALDAFEGVFDSKLDYAYDWFNQTGELEDLPDRLRNYFDYAAWVRDVQLEGSVSMVEVGGKVYVYGNQ